MSIKRMNRSQSDSRVRFAHQRELAAWLSSTVYKNNRLAPKPGAYMDSLSRLSNIRYNVKHLLILITVVAVQIIYCVTVTRNANREYDAYAKLRELGAYGDEDLFSFNEFITGKPPINYLYVPNSTEPTLVIGQLPSLNNLRHLDVAFDVLTPDEIDEIGNLNIESLAFSGVFSQSDDIGKLNNLHGIRSLELNAVHHSDQSIEQLKKMLPSTTISLIQ